MTKKEFAQQYLAAMGWNAPVVTDEDLMLEYPVCVYRFEGAQITAVCEDIPVEEVPQNEELDALLDALFDMESITAQRETVLGFYAPHDVDGAEELPPVMDEDILQELLDSLSEDDRTRGEVTMEDDFTASILLDGHMIAAAGAVLESERFADISLCVHPKMRGRGLGLRVLKCLIHRIRKAGCEPLYRVEDTNIPSVKLAKAAGLKIGFTMDGALLTFPEE